VDVGTSGAPRVLDDDGVVLEELDEAVGVDLELLEVVVDLVERVGGLGGEHLGAECVVDGLEHGRLVGGLLVLLLHLGGCALEVACEDLVEGGVDAKLMWNAWYLMVASSSSSWAMVQVVKMS
jgi:hypothetical protein